MADASSEDDDVPLAKVISQKNTPMKKSSAATTPTSPPPYIVLPDIGRVRPTPSKRGRPASQLTSPRKVTVKPNSIVSNQKREPKTCEKKVLDEEKAADAKTIEESDKKDELNSTAASDDKVVSKNPLKSNLNLNLKPASEVTETTREKETEEENDISSFFKEFKYPSSNIGLYKLLWTPFVHFLDVDPDDKQSLTDAKSSILSEDEKTFLSASNAFKSYKFEKDDKCILTEDAAQFIKLKASTAHVHYVFLDDKYILTEDAAEFIVENYPEKFKEFLSIVQRCEIKRIVLEQEKQRANVISGKIPAYLRRALRETVRYNSHLNIERKEERSAYFDLQTQIIHHPQKKAKYEPTFVCDTPQYPVAVIPGQFQDYFKRYTSEQLASFPLNTVTRVFKPLKPTVQPTKSPPAPMETKERQNKDEEMTILPPQQEKDNYCGLCMKGAESNKRGRAEALIHCSQCVNAGHPSCLEMSSNMVKVIATYQWQCMECKICTECLAPHDEEEMMFCDNCDRGYHSYCVGLKEIPKGRWVCTRCGKCCSCLKTTPSPDVNGEWINEFTQPKEEEGEFLQQHCQKCSRLFRAGSFCPVCLQVYCDEDGPISSMVCCDTCDRWIHTDCDGIDDHRYSELSADDKQPYTCVLCRGDKEERMATFHKQNRPA